MLVIIPVKKTRTADDQLHAYTLHFICVSCMMTKKKQHLPSRFSLLDSPMESWENPSFGMCLTFVAIKHVDIWWYMLYMLIYDDICYICWYMVIYDEICYIYMYGDIWRYVLYMLIYIIIYMMIYVVHVDIWLYRL